MDPLFVCIAVTVLAVPHLARAWALPAPVYPSLRQKFADTGGAG